MKDIPPTPTMWIDYTNQVKEEIGRNLTAAEMKLVMEAYINKVSVADIVEKLL